MQLTLPGKRIRRERTSNHLQRLLERWLPRAATSQTDTDCFGTEAGCADVWVLAKDDTSWGVPPGWTAIPSAIGTAAQPSYYRRDQ